MFQTTSSYPSCSPSRRHLRPPDVPLQSRNPLVHGPTALLLGRTKTTLMISKQGFEARKKSRLDHQIWAEAQKSALGVCLKLCSMPTMRWKRGSPGEFVCVEELSDGGGSEAG
jgi:hypothetical protein